MSGRHIFLRASHYYYVCRVPRDLLHHFPSSVVWKSLKTTNAKNARVIAATLEYKTQQLFLHLRSGMFDSTFLDHLVHQYLEAGLNCLESKEYLRKCKPGKISTLLDIYRDDDRIAVTSSEDRLEHLRDRLNFKDYDIYDDLNDQLIDIAKEKYKIKLTRDDKRELGMRVMQSELLLHEIDIAISRGEYSGLHQLKDRIEKTKPYFALKTVIESYQEKYVADRPDIKERTKETMKVECALLLELIGNVSIDVFNTMKSIVKLKELLAKYPKNRVQRFGLTEERSIQSILKSEKNYDIICHRTANNYIKRAQSIITHANKYGMLEKASTWDSELFKIDTADEGNRLPYDQSDIKHLVDALCTKNLWRYDPPKPERFWIILIALFQGLRLANITGLKKKDICLTVGGIWVFRVRFGKSENTIKDYPIHDCLLLFGFLEWTENLNRLKLFQDSSRQISSWWNRVDKNKDGKITASGFEYSYITEDPKKCLHSLRHHFAGEVYEVSQDYKATAEALGHSLSGKVTNGYIGKTRLKSRKELLDKLQFEDVDLNKLEARAQELFGVNLDFVSKHPAAEPGDLKP